MSLISKRAPGGRRAPEVLDHRWVDRAVAEYLARYSSTRAHLRDKLMMRVRTAEIRGAEVRPEIETLIDKALEKHVGLGTLNDAAWAESKASTLTRRGIAGRVVTQRLRERGVEGEASGEALATVADSLDPAVRELAAACAWMRRKRAGPFKREAFGREKPDPGGRKILAAMARGGFSYDVCSRALRLDLEEAEELIGRLG